MWGTASVHEGVSSHPPAPTRMCVSSRRPAQDTQEGEVDKMYTFPNCYYKRVQIQSNSGQPMAKIERTRTIGSCEKSSFCFSLQVSTAYTLPRSIFFGWRYAWDTIDDG